MSAPAAIVTGASRGIGAAIARTLAADGFSVVIGYHKNGEAAELVARDCQKLGAATWLFGGDLADFSVCQALVRQVVETFGRFDVLVNNAGVTQDGLLARMTEEQFGAVIDANLKSAFHMMRLVSPHMIRARKGRIINISSVSGLFGNAGQVNYAASKAGLIGMTLSAAKELGARGITCNAVAPGAIETDMTAVLSDAAKEALLGRVSLGRIGTAQEVADAVSFLASSKAAYITGQVLRVDGGMAL